MSENLTPLLIVIAVVILGLGGIFYLSNQKAGNPQINLTPTVYPSPTPVTAAPTNAMISGQPATAGAGMGNMITTADGLQIQDLTVGAGQTAKSGDTVTVNYIGTLESGTKFDSSYDRNQPFTTQIGVGQVIKGWDEGIVGMKVGGKRKLVIPPSLGYGSQATGGIPANSTLIFEVELLSIK
ncbi:MAG: FKBP-type peptidyl-prolyl cis-trans isomerase [Candidatus Levyibacteriota bacterium]|jgi:FKBP-type peptidyl-prolyl cis-trans isomerase